MYTFMLYSNSVQPSPIVEKTPNEIPEDTNSTEVENLTESETQ